MRNGLQTAKIERRVDIDGCRRSWYFNSNAIKGEMELDIIALDRKFSPMLIFELLHFISRVGALGARPQMGFGVVSAFPSDGAKIPRSLIADQLLKDRFLDNPKEEIWDGGMPALHNMFFAEIRPRDPNGVTDNSTFLIKKQIRDRFREGSNPAELRHFVCGHLDRQTRMGSKVMVSRPFVAANEQRIRRMAGIRGESRGSGRRGWIVGSRPRYATRLCIAKNIRLSEARA